MATTQTGRLLKIRPNSYLSKAFDFILFRATHSLHTHLFSVQIANHFFCFKMGFFSSLRLPSRAREPTMGKPYTQEAAMESIIVDEKYARVYTNDKRGSKRWTNSFIHPKYNQRISIIPQAEDMIWTPFAAADAPPQPEIPEPKSDFIQLMQIVEQMFKLPICYLEDILTSLGSLNNSN